MAAINQVVVEMLTIVQRAVGVEGRADTPTTTTTSSLAATSTSPVPSPSQSTGGSSSSTGPTSSPLLFFVALGFGVVFTNLWIIVGVKYCFRYNARNRQMRVGEDGEPINLENMPRPHRRRREKKLMSMDEVNERFPLVKYKNWVASRASEGLSTAGGVTAPGSRAASLMGVEGIVPLSPTKDKSRSVSRETSDDSDMSLDGPKDSDKTHPTESEKAVATHVEHDSSPHLPTLEEVNTTTSTVDPKQAVSTDEDEDDDEEHIHTAVPPELLATSGDTCAICIDTLEDDDEVRGLTCGHAFHASCLDPWLTSRRACCPLCKADYYTPKPRPEGEPAEGERETRRSRRAELNDRRMNLPQPPTSAWTGSRGSPFRGGPRMILPGRFMTNPVFPGDVYNTTNDTSRQRRRMQAAGGYPEEHIEDRAAVEATPAAGSTNWRSRMHVPNPFSNMRMPAVRIPGRSNANSADAPTPAQIEEGTVR